MYQKLQKPIIFDRDYDFVICGFDGERFFVAPKGSEDLVEDPLDFLEWSLDRDYPLYDFIHVQKALIRKCL